MVKNKNKKTFSLPKATHVAIKRPYYSALPDVLESAMAVEQVVIAETALDWSFIPQAFIEYLLYARHHAKHDGLSYKQSLPL